MQHKITMRLCTLLFLLKPLPNSTGYRYTAYSLNNKISITELRDLYMYRVCPYNLGSQELNWVQK